MNREAQTAMSKTTYQLDDLLYLMARLRDPATGCPWDIRQDYASIAPSTIEEAYEVVDAIEQQDFDHLNEELGDLLFQVIFYAQIGKEEGRFDFSSIVSDLVAKLIRRHPHVFPEGTLQSRVVDRHSLPQDIKQRWEIIKQQERAARGVQSVLDDVPTGLPALSRAAKLQKRAANVGFDWENIQGPVAKVREELIEVEQALAQQNAEHLSEELGDLLFAVVNVVRYLKEDPEQVLRSANRKFEKRFQYIERQLGDQLKTADIDSMNRLWDEAKTLKIS